MPRVAIGCFKYAANAFSPVHPSAADFTHEVGEAVLSARGTPGTLGGFIAGLEEAGLEILPTTHSRAQTAARLAAAVFRPLADDLLERMLAARPDAVLLELHGAALAENLDDPESWLVAQLRAALPNAPIVLVQDQHANPSPELVAAANAVIGAKTTPHVDFGERGLQAARLIDRLLRDEVRATCAISKPPLTPAMQNLHTIGHGPLDRLSRTAERHMDEPGVHDVSIFAGFAYSDVARAGLGVTATAEDPATARQIADELATLCWEERAAMLVDPIPLEAAVDRALQAPSGPIILADVADSPPGGGSSDTTALLAELLRRNTPDAVVASIWDPDAVAACHQAGLGARVTLSLGGKVDPAGGAPVGLTGEVVHLSDGTYAPQSPLSDALLARRGPTAVVRSGGLDVVITTRRSHCFELEFLRSLSIDPTARKILAIKSELHYVLAYAPIAAEILQVDAPGPVTPRLDRLPFKALRRPSFPLDL